jgi:WD40 repeat protein
VVGNGAAATSHKVAVSGCYAVSNDGRWIAVGESTGIVRVFNVKTGEERVRIAAHPEWATAIAFDPMSERLFTAGREGAIRVWDIATGVEVLTLVEPGRRRFEDLRFTADGTRLIGGGADLSHLVWQASPGK